MYKFDLLTLIIYFAIGGFCCILIKQSNRRFCYANGRISHGVSRDRYTWLFIVLLAVFAAIRGIDVGTDTITYESMFLDAFDSAKLAEMETLFVWYTKFIRLLTGNFRIYLFVSYLIIACSYIVFIKTYIPKQISFIPFVLVIFPFLTGLNTMRSSLAIAVFLIGLSLMKTRKFSGYLLMICSVFVHRMMVAFVFLPVFKYLFGKTIVRSNKTSYLMFVVFSTAIIFLLISILKTLVVRFGLLHGTDLSYINSINIAKLLKGNYVTLFPYFLLLIVLCLFGKKLDRSPESMAIKIFCTYDIVIVLSALFIGLWRINEVMYLGRLMLWGELIYIIVQSSKKKYRGAIKKLFGCLFVAWLVFRIVSVYQDAGLMPYFLWFH